MGSQRPSFGWLAGAARHHVQKYRGSVPGVGADCEAVNLKQEVSRTQQHKP